jgi:hypothetical protein
MDLLGREIEVGTLVLYPDGARFKTGVVRKLSTKTVKIVGVFEDNWYCDKILSKNKASHLTIAVNMEELLNHERREFARTHGERRLLNRSRVNNEWVEVYQTLEEFIDERRTLLFRLQVMLCDNGVFHEDDALKPDENEMEVLVQILKGGVYRKDDNIRRG